MEGRIRYVESETTFCVGYMRPIREFMPSVNPGEVVRIRKIFEPTCEVRAEVLRVYPNDILVRLCPGQSLGLANDLCETSVEVLRPEDNPYRHYYGEKGACQVCGAEESTVWFCKNNGSDSSPRLCTKCAHKAFEVLPRLLKSMDAWKACLKDARAHLRAILREE